MLSILRCGKYLMNCEENISDAVLPVEWLVLH
jgi:hypothetical protein